MKDNNNDIGSIKLKINQFEVGKVYKKWLAVEKKGNRTGLIKSIINVIESGINNLPSADSNSLSDPCFLFKILNTNISIKSRKIDITLNPVWDDYLNIPFNSLNSDILRLEIIDWDRVGKHDKLCIIDFPLINFIPGEIYSDTYFYFT